MTISLQQAGFSLDSALVDLLVQACEEHGITPGEAITFNFRDPSYSAETGGFHPVEIRIGRSGAIQYITDFTYVGQPPFEELAKEIDFDFSVGVFQHMGREFPIGDGAELFAIWQENFLGYHAMGVFKTKVSAG